MANDKPGISLNQLALYLTSDALKRRRIIEQRKEPKSFMVNWYDPAMSKISEFVMAGCANEDILVSEIDRLYAITPGSEYEQTRNNTNAEALLSFMDVYNDLVLEGFEIKRGDNMAPKMDIAGVDVSVRPEFWLVGKNRGEQAVGAIKLYFSKDTKLTKESGAYIPAVLAEYVGSNGNGATVSRKHCQVLDVFQQTLFLAPPSVKQRFKTVQIACEEIKLWWGAL